MSDMVGGGEVRHATDTLLMRCMSVLLFCSKSV